MDSLSKIQAQLSNSIFKSNITALVSIYKDSEENRLKKSTEIEAEIQKWSTDNTGKPFDQMEILPEDKIEDYNFYQYHFDYLLLNSLFISAFSLFEIHLKRLAKLAEKGFKSKIKVSDIKGNGEIDTIRKYLYLIHSIEKANNNTDEWKELLEFKAIRNSLVHHGGILNPEKKTKPETVIGFKKLKQHDIWMNPETIFFRLKKISFLEDFKRLTIEYSDSVTTELTNGH